MSRRARKPRRRIEKKTDAPAPPEVLAPEWRRWVAANLAGGASDSKVREALVSQGVPEAEARRRIEETRSSPIFAAVVDAARRAARYEQVLRLLGQQLHTRSEPRAVERIETPSAEVFFERWYATNTPVVLTDFMQDWPAIDRWTADDFAQRFGDVEVSVSEGRDGDPDYDIHALDLSDTTTMGSLVERVKAADEGSNDFYMVARNRNLEGGLRPLLDDVRADRGILDPDKPTGGCQLWFGPGGTVTPLHHDTSNILFCQIWGRKRVLLASPLERGLLHAPRAMYADVDPEAVDAQTHPWFESVQLREVELGAGDALFIPVGWWHHVRALEASISVAFVAFTRDNDCRWYTPGKR